MKTIPITTQLTFDDTQTTDEAVLSSLTDIVNTHGENLYSVSGFEEPVVEIALTRVHLLSFLKDATAVHMQYVPDKLGSLAYQAAMMEVTDKYVMILSGL